MAQQPKAARKSPKKSAKGPKRSPRAAPRKGKEPKPDAEVTTKRDARVEESGADMDDEAPEGDRHGDVRPGSRSPAKSKAALAAETLRHNRQAEHAHQDPRWTEPKMDAKWAKAKRDPRKEGGLSKDRQVRRLSGMTNWFRRAPKPKT